MNSHIDINQKEIENCCEFRLQEISLNSELCNNKKFCYETTTSISSYSNHKQRIDAMFDDGKSFISDVSKRDKNQKLVIDNQYIHQKAREKNVIANSIQEKIEKMFEEISLSTPSNVTFTTNEDSQKEYLKPLLFSSKSTVKEDFRVTYLGSKPLRNKNVNLVGLQSPLKELYFMYKKKPTEFKSGVLAICEEGLTMKTLNKEELNPFSKIAVWASVKLAFRAESGILEYAFLPLIANPDGTDKNSLFKPIDNEDKTVIFQNFHDENQFPIFAIVMKNLNINKQLECHGFICKSSEEAIVIAANLYHALIKKLKRKRNDKEDKIKETNNKITVSNTEEQKVNEDKIKVKKSVPAAPSKPPRKFCQTERKHIIVTSGSETLDALNRHQEQSNEITVDFRNLPQRRGSMPDTLLGNRASVERTLRRAVSDCGGHSTIVKNQCEGDILTKVAIPRSQSFLNANGPLQRFSRQNKTYAKNDNQSPLGFNELFNEFRLHEGLKSMDEILNVIIDAEGMSFNDLKPIYKEFLLKLAVILTKDELYHRSKVIMKRQKRKNKNYKFRKELFIPSMDLKKIFNKSSKKKKTKSPRSSNVEFTSVVVQSSGKHWESKSNKINKGRKSFRAKTKSNHWRQLPKRVTSKFHSTTSEKNDFIRSTWNINRRKWRYNMTSSGHFSYSDCSYDSENCTCSSTDKCYCALSKEKLDVSGSLNSQAISRISCINLQPKINWEPDDSLKTCSCDTVSCADSGKCYCMRREIRKFYSKLFRSSDIKRISQTVHFPKRGTLHNASNFKLTVNSNNGHEKFMLNQVKNGIFGSDDSPLIRANIVANTWRINEKNSKKKRHIKRNKKTEFLPIRTLRSDHPIQRNLPNFKFYSNSEYRNFKKFQDFTKNIEARNFEEFGDSNEDLFRRVVRKRNAHSISKSSEAKRQYSSMRCRKEFISDLIISKPFYRSMSCRTKRLFGSVSSKRNCDDIMNHIKFPNASSSNISLRFRRRMDVYDSLSGNKFIGFQTDSTHHSHPKKGVTQNLPSESYELENSSEGFDGEKSTGNLQRSENKVIKINHEKPDFALNQTEKKMLVVSARDPKGKVLFMGANNSKSDSVKNFRIFLGNNNTTNAGEAMAVKKSAEIVSLFSNSLIKQKISHGDYVPEKENHQTRSKSYDLEHSLGYLP